MPASQHIRDGGFCLEGLANGWTVGRFAALSSLEYVQHAVTTRQGLDVNLIASDHAAAAGKLAEAMGLDGLAWCEQVHGPSVLTVGSPGQAGPADALVTSRKGLGLMVRGADCPLILVADPTAGACGAAHASWRSTVGGIASRLVLEMTASAGAKPGQMVACICPSAGPCCYEVGADVVAAAGAGLGAEASQFFRNRDGRLFFDLWSANVAQLTRMGVPAESIHLAGMCTICRNDLFPSHRREGSAAGRFAAVIAQR